MDFKRFNRRINTKECEIKCKNELERKQRWCLTSNNDKINACFISVEYDYNQCVKKCHGKIFGHKNL